MNEVSVIMTLLVIYLIAILAGIAVNVLLALAAYQDARARGNQNATMSVSYTHLDVYKRQVHLSPPAARAAA